MLLFNLTFSCLRISCSASFVFIDHVQLSPLSHVVKVSNVFNVFNSVSTRFLTGPRFFPLSHRPAGLFRAKHYLRPRKLGIIILLPPLSPYLLLHCTTISILHCTVVFCTAPLSVFSPAGVFVKSLTWVGSRVAGGRSAWVSRGLA